MNGWEKLLWDSYSFISNVLNVFSSPKLFLMLMSKNWLDSSKNWLKRTRKSAVMMMMMKKMMMTKRKRRRMTTTKMMMMIFKIF